MNKVALITGSSRGLGKAIAHELANAGYFVAINARSSSQVEQTVCEFKAIGLQAMGIIGDIANEHDWCRIVKEATNHGNLEILVNNAGIYAKPSAQSDEFKDTYAKIKIHGTIAMSDYAIQAEVRSIVNVSSSYGLNPNFKARFASAMQAGLISLTKAYSREYIGKVQVNAICPGYMNTQMVTDNFDVNEVIERTPLGRLIEPVEVARTVIQIIAQPLITGQIFVLDGGQLLV